MKASSPLCSPLNAPLCAMKKATEKLIVSTSAPNRVSKPTIINAEQTTSAKTTNARLVACPTPRRSGKFDDSWLKPLNLARPWLSDKVRPSQTRNTSNARLVQTDAVPGAKIFLSIGVWVENSATAGQWKSGRWESEQVGTG